MFPLRLDSPHAYGIAGAMRDGFDRVLRNQGERVRSVFRQHHADLRSPGVWPLHPARIRAGRVSDMFPYDNERRFTHGGATLSSIPTAGDPA